MVYGGKSFKFEILREALMNTECSPQVKLETIRFPYTEPEKPKHIEAVAYIEKRDGSRLAVMLSGRVPSQQLMKFVHLKKTNLSYDDWCVIFNRDYFLHPSNPDFGSAVQYLRKKGIKAVASADGIPEEWLCS